MSQNEPNLVSPTMDKITFAHFAKIKIENTLMDEYINEPDVLKANDGTQIKVKCELLDFNIKTEESCESDSLVPVKRNEDHSFGNAAELRSLLETETGIECKSELLQAYDIEDSVRSIKQQIDLTSQINSGLSISINSETSKIILPIKADAIPVNNEHQPKDVLDIEEKPLFVEKNTSMFFPQRENTEINESSKRSNIKTIKNLQESHFIDTIESNDSNVGDTYKITYSAIGKEKNEMNITKKSKIETLVKNPFSFLKKKFSKFSTENSNQSQIISFNNSIKSEPICIDLKLATACSSNSTDSLEDIKENNIALEMLAEQSSNDLNEISIKSQYLSISERNQDIYKSASSNINCSTCNLDSSSLDVNFSIEDPDTDDLESNVSINNTSGYSKYSSAIEIFSDENSQLIETIKTPNKQKPNYKNFRNMHKQGKRQAQCKQNYKIKLRTLKRKINKPIRYADKDVAKKKTNSAKKKKKQGRKVNKAIIKNEANTVREDFPRPLKSERLNVQNDHTVAIELPKPMMFKNEFALEVKNKKSYQKPEFQPRIYLQRIKSEELLVLPKNKYVRKTRKFKSAENVNKGLRCHQKASTDRSNLLIQRAYSLNTCTELNRLSIDHDHYYCNGKASLNSSHTSAESLNETESKYFSQQEIYSDLQSYNPHVSSIYDNGPIDSGVSISAPSSNHHSTEYNRTILLKIAAERAFINNHLVYFGYSPIQFDLYNNLNDLNVFLKYLLPNVNQN